MASVTSEGRWPWPSSIGVRRASMLRSGETTTVKPQNMMISLTRSRIACCRRVHFAAGLAVRHDERPTFHPGVSLERKRQDANNDFGGYSPAIAQQVPGDESSFLALRIQHVRRSRCTDRLIKLL